jgi:CheY-like chemotaxis protein
MRKQMLLVVEDDPAVLNLVRCVLEDGGYTVVAAVDGQSAIHLFNQHMDDIAGIITDIRLPAGPDGWAIARHAREHRPEIAVVYTTGESTRDWLDKSIGQSLVIEKPYAPDLLVTAISTLLTEG